MSLVKLAALNKKAGVLNTAGEQLTNFAFNKGLKNTANVLGKNVGEAVQQGGSGLLGKVKNLFANKPVAQIIPKRAIAGQNYMGGAITPLNAAR